MQNAECRIIGAKPIVKIESGKWQVESFRAKPIVNAKCKAQSAIKFEMRNSKFEMSFARSKKTIKVYRTVTNHFRFVTVRICLINTYLLFSLHLNMRLWFCCNKL